MLDRRNGTRERATDRLRRGVADLAKTTGGLIAAGLDAGSGGRTRGTFGIPFHHRIAHPTTGVSPPSLDASPERGSAAGSRPRWSSSNRRPARSVGVDSRQPSGTPGGRSRPSWMAGTCGWRRADGCSSRSRKRDRGLRGMHPTPPLR
jgi:hypothetical protein